MNTDEIALLMNESGQHIRWSCAETAGAMAGLLKKLHPQLSNDDFNYLIIIGGVLFREGLREYEYEGMARDVINSMMDK